MELNGLRKWLIGTGTVILLAWATWVSSGVVDAWANAALDKEIARRLISIEQKVDQIQLELRQGGVK